MSSGYSITDKWHGSYDKNEVVKRLRLRWPGSFKALLSVHKVELSPRFITNYSNGIG